MISAPPDVTGVRERPLRETVASEVGPSGEVGGGVIAQVVFLPKLIAARRSSASQFSCYPLHAAPTIVERGPGCQQTINGGVGCCPAGATAGTAARRLVSGSNRPGTPGRG